MNSIKEFNGKNGGYIYVKDDHIAIIVHWGNGTYTTYLDGCRVGPEYTYSLEAAKVIAKYRITKV